MSAQHTLDEARLIAAAPRERLTDVDFFSPGARLALELECLLMDTRNDAVQSRWWDSAHEALEQWRQALRAMESAIDAAQPEASTTLEQADDHARICFKLAEQYKSDPVLFAALTDAAAIIRDLMRELRQETERRWDGNRRSTFAALIRNAALEEAIKVIEYYPFPVGNSAAGELACEWTRDALEDIRDAILELKKNSNGE